MNKLRVILLAISLVSTTTAIASPVCSKNFGLMECGNGTVSNIDFTGLLEMNGTTVANSFDVLGNVEMKNADVTNMHVKGICTMKDTKINGYMNVTGEVNANKVKITGATVITGNFFSKNVELNSVTKITGIAKCDNCNFHNLTEFTGEVSVGNSQFDSKIEIEARESIFSNTKLQDIYVKKSPQHDEEVIVLSQGSVAKNITFEDANGKVILKNGSHITGRVEGGKIVNN